MIKIKKIILGILILLMTVSAFIYTKNKTFNKKTFETTFEINREVRTPLTIMGIKINKFIPDAVHPITETAFGIKMGDVFDTKRAINEHKLSTGTSLYEIEPILPHSGSGRFYITTNRKTNKIMSIRGIEIYSSLKEAQVEVFKLREILEQKYDLVTEGENFRYYKDERGDLILLFIEKVGDRYEVHLHCLCS